MTVPVVTPFNSYVGNGTTPGPFSFSFAIFTSSQLTVTATDSSGNVSTLVLTTDYTVSGLNAAGSPASTGSITLVNAGQVWLSSGNLATGFTLIIAQAIPYSQSTSIRNQGDFLRGALEDALDNIVKELQQVQSTALILPPGITPATFSPILPTNMVQNPGKVLLVNPTGTALILGTPTTSVIANPLLASQGGTGASQTLVGNRILKSVAQTIVEAAAIAAAKMLISDPNGIPIAANTDADMGTNKILNLKNGTGAQDAAAYSQLKVLQTIVGTSVTALATNSSTLQATNLFANITPTNAANRVLIIVTGNLRCANPSNASARITIKRGSTDIGPANGFIEVAGAQTTNTINPAAIVWIDSPASTSVTGYQVFIHNTDNVTTVEWGTDTQQTIILMEVV